MVDFRAYFVKWGKYKMPDCARKECSSKKVEEKKSGFEFNFTLEFIKCPETLRLRGIQAFGYLVIFSTSPNIYILLGKAIGSS